MAKKEYQDENGKTYTIKEKKPLYKKWWFIALIVIVIISLIPNDKNNNGDENKAVNNTTTNDTKSENIASKEDSTEEKVADYEITELNVDTSDYFPKATGKLKNNSGEEKSLVQITFPVKDKECNKLGTAVAMVNDLKDGETWKFEAASLEDEEGATIDLENYEVSGF